MNGILYCLNLNLSMHFRIRSGRPVTFKTKLSVTTVNNCSQLLTFFCLKELHLRCCIRLELNIVIWFKKNLKGIKEHPPMIECSVGKLWKAHSPWFPKNTFPEVFHISCFAFNINGLNGVNINSLTHCGIVNLCVVYLVKSHNHLISTNPT